MIHDGPWWLIVSAIVLVLLGALASLHVDERELRGDLAGAYVAWIISRSLALAGVLVGAAGLVWELAR